MRIPSVALCSVGGVILVSALAYGASHDAVGPQLSKMQVQQHFLTQNPDADFFMRDSGEIGRVYGKAFSQGATPEASIDSFLAANVGMWGLTLDNLEAGGRFKDNRLTQPIMPDRVNGGYKFTGHYYQQVVEGVPVYGSEIVLLLRNDADNSMVLASSTLKDLDGFALAEAPQFVNHAMVAKAARERFGNDAQVTDAKHVIWVGTEEAGPGEATLAVESYIRIDVDEWIIITDAQDGQILHEEHKICLIDITGNVSGNATEGIGAEQCEEEVPMALPFLEVFAGADMAVTDENGDFVIPHDGANNIAVTAGLVGTWFEVINWLGAEDTESETVFPPGPANLFFNTDNTDEQVRAQVNTYLESNRVRTTLINANPNYPESDILKFPAYTNRTDGFCPGNAWYSPGERSINFCLSGQGSPNTSWTSVIHHEYGHHIVEAGGSGQGEYGEGMGDVMSTLILDSNFLGWGFHGDCNSSLRNADNTLTFPCVGGIHHCGQVISGAVWETRNEMISTEPNDYITILADLACNSVLVHTGSSITPQITIDWLTLDDDNGDIGDGTPHYNEIATGFGAKNLDAPPLALIGFEYPDGRPDNVDPAGGEALLVNVVSFSGTPVEGTGMFFYDAGDGFVQGTFLDLGNNMYEAIFPAVDCGVILDYYFQAEATTGDLQFSPSGAPAATFTAAASFGSTPVFGDDFEDDNGWAITNGGGLSDGAWDRGVPVGGGDRGDPPTDGDGSGQCYLTDNTDGNSDVDGGSTTLTSPLLDASGDVVSVSYYRWYSNTFGGAPEADIFEVEVSDDNGATWTDLETVGPTGPEVDGGWIFKEFTLNTIPGFERNDQFRIRFTASDLGTGSVVEAGVDGIAISQVDCGSGTPCIGDADESGEVDITDLLGLLAAWGTDNADYDFVSDGNVDIQDLLALLAAWGPCPK